MGKVYIVQEAIGKNFLPAQTFGELEVLLPQGQIVLSPGPTMYRLRKKLEHYNDNDYLLCIGDPICIALAAVVASSVNNGKVNFLKWDRRHEKYLPIKTNLFQNSSEA